MAFEFVKNEYKRGRSTGEAVGIRMTISKSGKGRPVGFKVRLGLDVMKKMRWMSGDLVQIGFDRELRLIKIQRVGTGGYRLGSIWKKRKNTGTCVPCSFRMQSVSMPTDVMALMMKILGDDGCETTDYIVETDGIVFDWPSCSGSKMD